MRISDWSSDVCSSDLEAGELPEDQQQQHVVGQHDAHHGALEQQQVGVELPHRVVLGEVEARVGDDQQADRQDQPGEEQAEARSEEHTSELQSLMRISYAVFCLKKKKTKKEKHIMTRRNRQTEHYYDKCEKPTG